MTRCYVCNAEPQDGCQAIGGEVAECPRPSLPSDEPKPEPTNAPAGYVWAIAELVSDPFCPSGYLRTRPELGRFWLHSEARKSIEARRGAHSMTLVPVLIEDVSVVCEDGAAPGSGS